MKMKKSLGILLFCFATISIAQASDFPKLDEAIPGSFVSKLAPVFDFDGDGCYPSAGISRSGKPNSGLKPTGSITGKCRNRSFLNYSNTLHRYTCEKKNNSTYCGHFYALYFLKDDMVAGIATVDEHRHDWEYVAIWTKNGTITHGSYSAHGKLYIESLSSLPMVNGHIKIVYHKEAFRTHTMRLAKSNESAENSYGKFVTPTLISWYELTGDDINNQTMISKLNSFNYGSASIPMKDTNFLNNLNKFKPSGYPKFTTLNPNDDAGKPNYCKWTTNWFSEEQSNGQECPTGQVVSGVQCKGRYCDNKKLFCCTISGLTVSGSTQNSSFFSEERTNYYKNDGKAVVGMRCKGRYCDDISLKMKNVNNNARGRWTSSFSEEQGIMTCDNNEYVAGVKCTGRYCDNLNLYCNKKVR
ncbi:NPP1 family protein [Candidatus Marithrix sp. Canyon 246]|uniref:NPP1 family protein n=1 Tax=Candidatus Marithrix sp. Canyon 246 TaxID=1827136 RepID=UPI00084A0E3F|nr:NPP1 family protein [Candidatus Marithrix sp. Canyon 246]